MKVTDHQRELRNALAAFATGVALVTTADDAGAPVGMTINSFASVSLNPPLVLWSIDKKSVWFDTFTRCNHFAIHVLTHDQQEISNTFAARNNNRFDLVNWQPDPHGTPLLDDCCSRFVCRTEHRYDGGDHIILVGRVLDFEYRDSLPLLFHRGEYKSLR